MEASEQTIEFIPSRGFYPSQSARPPIEGTVIDGANCLPRGPGLWKPYRGYTSFGSPAMGAAANPTMVSASVPSGMTGGGTVTRHAQVPWAAGSGTAIEGATVLGAVSGQLMVYVGGTLVAAGLAAPAAPTIADSGVASGKLNGSYAISLVAYRNTTGALSSTSPMSAALSVRNKKIRITFPAAPTGATHWIIYGTRRGFGSVGPTFRVTTIALTAIAVGTATFDAEWFDGELGEISPIDYDPPPSGVTHCAGLGGSMVAIGPLGRVSPSIVGRSEAFPASFVTFLPSREGVTGVTARGTDGIVYVATANSLNALLVSGSDLTPVLPRGIWENTGFASGSAFCLVEDQIYGMAGGGPVRTHGGSEPDRSFAAPILQYMLDNGWSSANTVVVYAPDNHVVYFASGTKCLMYFLAGEEEGTWSTPVDVPSVTSGVTVSGVGYVSSGSTLYSLDKAGGTTGTAFMTFPYYGDDRFKTLRYFKMDTASGVTADLLNYGTGTSFGSPFPISISAPQSNWAPLNLLCPTGGFALKVTFTSTGHWRGAVLDFIIDPIHSPNS